MNLDKFYKQTLSYWGTPVANGYGGWSWDAPIEIKGRWVDKQELFINAAGEQVLSKAKVFVDRDLDMGGYIYSGTSSTVDPTDVVGAHRIEGWKKVASTVIDNYLRVVWL